MRIVLSLILTGWFALAQASTEIVRQDGYEVQIQPFPSTFLTPEVANTYGFERSRRQVLLNVVVLKVQPNGLARGAVNASVEGFAKNLIGQTQTLEFKEIDEGEEAIYYLAPVRVSNEETIQVLLTVIPASGKAIDIDFRRKVYVD